MSRRDENRNLDRFLAEIRDEPVDPAAAKAASERVRLRLRAAATPVSDPTEQGAVEGCPGYQALFPSYLRSELSPARTLLLEDHVRECVSCRKALREERSPRSVATHRAATADSSRPVSRTARWAIAASLLVGLGLAAYGLKDRLLPSPFEATARVQSIDGDLFRLTNGTIHAIGVGETIEEGERLRAGGRGSSAFVRLADGSELEMRERSELSLARQRDGVAVDLAMGSVIVHAAPQGAGHLYVKSDDCLVSVTGTIFTVNHDLKGSKVSVVEGSVEVRFGEEAFHLKPGEQVATSTSLEKTSVESEISWSRNVDQYLALLHELRALQKSLDAEVARPGLRTSTRLLDQAPDGTIFYAAIPNVSASLVEARRVLRDKVEQSPVLKEWWDQKVAPLGGEAAVDDALLRMRALGDQLGDEIVITFQRHLQGAAPLLLAEVRNPDALKAALAAEIARVTPSTQTVPFARILEDAEVAGTAPSGGDRSRAMLFWVRDGLLVASPDLSAVRELARRGAHAEAGAFAQGSFHQRLSDAYRDGVGWLVGLDLHAILDLEGAPARREALQSAGVLDAEHLIVEANEEDGQLRDRALLTFDQPRRGVASWLASPGPMGGLRFISPDATLAAGFVVKDPVALVEDAYGLLRASDSEFERHIEEFSTKTGIDLVRDLAGPLGGEMAFALDGPVLPFPAWKLVVEVNDPARLQDTIARLVDRANRSAEPNGVTGLRIDREEVGARTFFSLSSEQPKFEVHYVFVDGYLLVAPQRVLLERAMQQRESHYDLPSSPRFIALLPRDARTSFSAVAYQNLGAVTGPIAQGIAGHTESLTPDQQRALLTLTADAPAGLAYAYAERDRIVFGGSRSGGIVSVLGSFLGLDEPQAFHTLMGELGRARSSGKAAGPGDEPSQ